MNIPMLIFVNVLVRKSKSETKSQETKRAKEVASKYVIVILYIP